MGIFDFISNPVAGIAGSLIGGAAQFFGTEQSNQMAQNMQQQQEAYNTQMSNTAYQRASADMKAAGLNPMMMFGSGGAASTPQAPQAQLSSPIQGAGSTIQNAVNSAMQMKTANATIDNLVQQNANLKTDKALREAQTQTEYTQRHLTQSKANLADAAIHEAYRSAQQADSEMEFGATPAGKLLYQTAMGGRLAGQTISPLTDITSSAKHIYSMNNPYGGF